MFDQSELYLLSKLLKTIKYSDLDIYEIDMFANSPLTNSILQKLETQLNQSPKISFKFESNLGEIVKERIMRMEDSSISTIASLYPEEIEKFGIDILGPIQYERIELDNLIQFIQNFVAEKAVKKVTLNTKSNNRKIKILHQSIAKNETIEFDFWTSMGYLDLKKQFLNFTEQDWIDLENDLINWNLTQLKILANSFESIPEISQLNNLQKSVLNVIKQIQ
jgi:hypothetical protein